MIQRYIIISLECCVYFSYKVLFKELRNIDSVVEGTEKLMKTFLHSIANGKLDYTTEDVRGTAVVQCHLCMLSTSNLRNL